MCYNHWSICYDPSCRCIWQFQPAHRWQKGCSAKQVWWCQTCGCGLNNSTLEAMLKVRDVQSKLMHNLNWWLESLEHQLSKSDNVRWFQLVNKIKRKHMDILIIFIFNIYTKFCHYVPSWWVTVCDLFS